MRVSTSFALICLTAVLPAMAQQQQTVSGTVTNALTGLAVPGAEVELAAYEQVPSAWSSTPSRKTLTDAAGRFVFQTPPLRAGRLTARKGGFSPSGLVTISGAAENLVLKLTPGGEISGRVTDGEGATVPGILVEATAEMFERGARQPRLRGGAITDQQGNYRIGGLSANTYHLRAVTQSTSAAMVHGPVFFPGVDGDCGPNWCTRCIWRNDSR